MEDKEEIYDNFALEGEVDTISYHNQKLKKSLSIKYKSNQHPNPNNERWRSNSLFQFAIRPQDVPHPKPKKSDVCPSPMNLKYSINCDQPNLSKKDSSLFMKELNAISYPGSDDEDYLSDSDDFSLDTSDNSSVEAPSESYVKKIRTDMKKKMRESINEINDRKPSNEYENFLSEEKVNTIFVLEEKPQKKKKSIWKKHIAKEIKAVNDSLYTRHTISNEKGFSILRVLESNAIENNSLIRGGSVL